MAPLEVKTGGKLEKEVRFEALLNEISTFFINLPVDRIDSEIEIAQNRVCHFLNLDRSTLFQINEENPRMILTHLYQPSESRIPPDQMSLIDFSPG